MTVIYDKVGELTEVAKFTINQLSNETQDNVIEILFQIIDDETGISKQSMQGQGRTYTAVFARYIFCRIARYYLELPLKSIARMLCRDHTTIIHALKEGQNLIDTHHNDWESQHNKCLQEMRTVLAFQQKRTKYLNK